MPLYRESESKSGHYPAPVCATAPIQGPSLAGTHDPTFNQLLDFRRVTKVALDIEAIRTAASRTIFVRGSRKAIVIPTEELVRLSRMFDMFRGMQGGEESLRVFRDMDEAWQWLSVGSAYARDYWGVAVPSKPTITDETDGRSAAAPVKLTSGKGSASLDSLNPRQKER